MLDALEKIEEGVEELKGELKEAEKTIDLTKLDSKELRDLILGAYSQIRKNFNIKPQEVDYSEIQKSFNERYEGSFIAWDRKFYACTAEEYDRIAGFLWQDLKEWVKNHYDCDNFGGAWKVFCYEIFGITAVGLSVGTVYDKDTGNRIGGHAYGHNYTTDKGVLLFEAESDRRTDSHIIGKWRYETDKSYWW